MHAGLKKAPPAKKALVKAAIAKAGRANGGPPEPDRHGRFLGLSLHGHHEIAYTDWGPPDDPRPVVCVHGLTRQGRDFDHLAAALAARGRRVVCPDLAGRGRSGRLARAEDYALPQYCADMNALVARLGVDAVDWVGTSLGGLVGIVMAGMPGSAIRRLVINDIGPFIGGPGLLRIGGYIAEMPKGFASLEAAEAYFRSVLAPFGDLSDAQWSHLTRHGVAWDAAAGHFKMLCDPGIARVFRVPWFYSLNLWKYWEAIRGPVQVLHGARSDLLTFELSAEMAARNRNVSTVHFAECGHAPPLMEARQIDPVVAFLQEGRRQGATI